jgi:lipooligosaccharide transport system permease protein
MSTPKFARQGSLKIVDLRKVLSFGALFVTASRLRIMWKWRWSIAGEAIANPLFYLLSIGIGIGKFVGSHQSAGIDGVSYLKFLAPALLASACIIGAVNEVMHPTLEGFKWNKNFFAMNATPLSSTQIADGVLGAALVRALFGTVMYYLALLAFGGVSGLKSLLLLPATMLAAAAFASVMLGVCAAVENPDLLLNIVNRLLIMPLFLFSGTFYSLKTMPYFLQIIGWLSPLWHATEIGRWIAYGHSISAPGLGIHFAYMTVMLIIGVYYSRHFFTQRLAK